MLINLKKYGNGLNYQMSIEANLIKEVRLIFKTLPEVEHKSLPDINFNDRIENILQQVEQEYRLLSNKKQKEMSMGEVNVHIPHNQNEFARPRLDRDDSRPILTRTQEPREPIEQPALVAYEAIPSSTNNSTSPYFWMKKNLRASKNSLEEFILFPAEFVLEISWYTNRGSREDNFYLTIGGDERIIFSFEEFVRFMKGINSSTNQFETVPTEEFFTIVNSRPIDEITELYIQYLCWKKSLGDYHFKNMIDYINSKKGKTQ